MHTGTHDMYVYNLPILSHTTVDGEGQLHALLAMGRCCRVARSPRAGRLAVLVT